MPGDNRVHLLHISLVRDLDMQHRHDALVILDRMIDLVKADFRTHRFRRNHENEVICGLNPRADFPPPILGIFNVLPIDPGVLALRFERIKKLLDEGFVRSRIGDKDVGHCATHSHWNQLSSHGGSIACDRASSKVNLQAHQFRMSKP